MTAKRRAGLLLTGLILTACGGNGVPAPAPASPPAPPATATPRPGSGQAALFELSVNGAGELAQASVSPVGGLSAQAGEVEFSQLKFEQLSMVNLRDLAARTNHMTATFRVTNNTGKTITTPAYVPVDTDGAYATAGSTPFRLVTTRNGTPADDKAGQLSIEVSHQQTGGTIQPDPAATPLVDGLDVGGLSLGTPAGTTVPGVSHRGWQAQTLAPGESQVITFAVRGPLSGADDVDPAADPFSFRLVFAVVDGAQVVPGLGSIASVQGVTPAGDAASPRAGQSATVEGVVTATVPGLQGFFVQEEGIDQDADADTSEGVFVYCGANCPDLSQGDRVRVTGTVAEYGGGTQLTAPTVTRLRSGVPLPAPEALDLPQDALTLERFEGMRLTFPEPLTVTNNYTYHRYGQVDLSNAGRVFQRTNGNDAPAEPQSVITLDDGVSQQNPSSLPFGVLRTGSTVTGLSGVWHTVANKPMLEPDSQVAFVPAPRSEQPKDVGGTLKVAGANVLNYFTTLGSAGRGASTAAEFQRQRAKTATALTSLNADIITLMEVENNGETALNDLVAALNEKAGASTFASVQTGTVGTDAIRVAIIYKPARVTPVGAPQIDTDPINNRPPVAQTFLDRATGGKLSVVANHFKSKGSCPSSGDTDQGQGCWNLLRTQQAQRLLTFVQTVQQSSGDSDVLLLGDFNAYGQEDPIRALQGGGFESLNLRISSEDRYSYQFGGSFGYLDHALSSPSLSRQVTGITEWHINSDEPLNADYNVEYRNTPGCTGTNCTGADFFDPATPFRASDHDPVLVGLNLMADAAPQPTLTLTPSSAEVGVVAGSTAEASFTATQTFMDGPISVTVTPLDGAPGLVGAPASVVAGTPFAVTVAAPADTAPGTYRYQVAAQNGSQQASAALTVTVTSGSAGPVTPDPGAGPAHLVISQVYGGGGNSGAQYKNDFIELFNPTAADINLSGYTLEYFSKAGGSGGKTALSGTVRAGGYFLVAQAAGTGGTLSLPTPDASGKLNMSATDGAVALSGASGVVDLVGYGAANKFEAAAASGASNAAALFRKSGGCLDTDNNSADFSAAAAAPRNSAAALNPCLN